MALTAAQKITLNKLLAQHPATSTRPNMLADMWEALTTPAALAIKAEWKTETAAKIAATKAAVGAAFDDGTGTINDA